MCGCPLNPTTKPWGPEAGDESDCYNVDGTMSSSERCSEAVADEHGEIRPFGCLKTQLRSRDCR
jgi:hypothetical protein